MNGELNLTANFERKGATSYPCIGMNFIPKGAKSTKMIIIKIVFIGRFSQNDKRQYPCRRCKTKRSESGQFKTLDLLKKTL